jgi:hypothetical protein
MGSAALGALDIQGRSFVHASEPSQHAVDVPKGHGIGVEVPPVRVRAAVVVPTTLVLDQDERIIPTLAAPEERELGHAR